MPRGPRPPSIMLEQRALRPGGRRGAPTDADVVPNDNDPGDVPPATVGADTYTAGDPNGVELTQVGTPSAFPRSTILPSPWSGLPSTWQPLFNGLGGRYEDLVDTAWGCIDLNASILATMPPYSTKSGVIVRSPTWLANPDPDLYTSWEEFAKQLFWDYHLGEAFVLVTARDAEGWPARFHVVPAWLVNVEMDRGTRVYHIGSLDVTDDILHIRYKSRTDDARGHGPLEAGRSRMIAAGVLGRYAQTIAESGGVPHSVITVEDELSDHQVDKLLHQWYRSRTEHLGLPAVLSGGATISPLQSTPRDMALVEIAQFNESRLAVLLGVPPFLAGLPSGGDSMTYSNISSLFDFHWRAGLRPKVGPVMSALSFWATPRGTAIELNRDEYVRPGLPERASAYATLNGIQDETGRVLSASQIVALERFNGHGAVEALTGGTTP